VVSKVVLLITYFSDLIHIYKKRVKNKLQQFFVLLFSKFMPLISTNTSNSTDFKVPIAHINRFIVD
jgi:hypothetical protein